MNVTNWKDLIPETNNVLNDQFKTSKNISVEKDLAKKVCKEILNVNESLNTILQNELGLEKTSNGLVKTRQKLIKDQLTLQTLLNTQFTEDAELNFEINKQLKEQIGNIDKLLGKVKNVEEESKKKKDPRPCFVIKKKHHRIPCQFIIIIYSQIRNYLLSHSN